MIIFIQNANKSSEKSEPPSFPERPLNLRARAGKNYFKIMIFWINLLDFYWIFICRLQNSHFSNFSIFCIFAARCKKIIASLLVYESSFLFDQKIELTCLENDTLGFSILLDISIRNLWKTTENYISASNQKFCPKSATRQRQKESASYNY